MGGQRGYYTCSECGQRFYVYLGESYQYKTNTSKKYKGNVVNAVLYQCSYTCNDHARLRFERYSKRITKENFNKYVRDSESAMRKQGKTVLHEIELMKDD